MLILPVLGCGATRSPAPRGASRGDQALLLKRAEILRAEDLRDPRAARSALADESPVVRAAAVLALGRIRDPEDRARIETALGDPAAPVRSQAAIALGLLRDRSAAAALAARVSDPDPSVRAAVACALGRLGTADANDGLRALLDDEDRNVLVAASFALLGFDRPSFAVDRLLELGAAENAEVLLAANETLARISARPRSLELEPLDRVRARMIELTKSRHAELRRLGAVGLTVPRSDPEAAAVGRLVEDEIAEVRIAAIGALSFPGAPLEPFLVKVLKDKDERVRLAVVEGLGRMRGDEIMNALADFVVSNEPLWLRVAAVRAAARVSELSPRLAAGISRAREPQMRQASAALLIGHIDGETEAYARRLYEDDDTLVQAAIVPAFAEIEGNLAELLADSISVGEPRLRAAVAEAAGRRLAGEGAVGPESRDDAIAVLEELWSRGGSDERTALAIVSAAGRGPADDRLRAVLEAALDSPDRAVREAAWRVLARVHGDTRPAPDPRIPDRPVEDYVEILEWADAAHAAIVTVERPGAGESARFAFRLDSREKPLAAWGFAQLASSGFYDGLPFFRVSPNAFVATGDPALDGTGRPAVEIRDELGPERFWPGTVARVSNGRDDGGSQWLVTLRTQPQLAATDTAFGTVTQNFAGVVGRILPEDRIVGIRIYDGDGTEPLPESP